MISYKMREEMECQALMVRAVRGATTVDSNSEQEILEHTAALLQEMVAQNGIETDDIISVLFSVTKDLNAAFPAVAARKLGWNRIALMCTYEMDVPGSLPNCIRVLMQINTEKKNSELKYIYQREAVKLRPDLFDPHRQTEG